MISLVDPRAEQNVLLVARSPYLPGADYASSETGVNYSSEDEGLGIHRVRKFMSRPELLAIDAMAALA